MNCFVIMPFSLDTSSSIYEDWIKSAVEEVRINDQKIICTRGDKSLRPGEIVRDITEYLVNSDIVIADMTSQNPNVFYELGVRHALMNNTILITQNLNDIPFDLRTQRIIEYQFTPDGMLKLKETLKAFIREIVTTPERIDNPVKRYLSETESNKGFKQLHMDEGMKVCSQLIKSSTLIKCIGTARQSSIKNNAYVRDYLTASENIFLSTEKEIHYYRITTIDMESKFKEHLKTCAENALNNGHYFEVAFLKHELDLVLTYIIFDKSAVVVTLSNFIASNLRDNRLKLISYDENIVSGFDRHFDDAWSKQTIKVSDPKSFA